MKFPYGICDFKEVVTKDYFYCDRTDRIPLIEKSGKYILFIRPRRFGKSMLISMLANYYDIALKDEFGKIFSHLKIGQNPTELCNSFFILEWDFSCVDPMGDANDIKKALDDHINSCIERFIVYYREYLKFKISIDPENAINSINSLITATEAQGCPVYLLIDEYDNFANEVMMGVRKEREGLYEALVYEEGPLKTLFKAIKSSTKKSIFDRIFITGVSPVVMSDITSGFNIAENIYLEPEFNDLCGFTAEETQAIVKKVARECGLDDKNTEECLGLMETYYNGYTFSPESDRKVYNPTLAVYFLKAFHKKCKYPRRMLDANLATDGAKLEYVANIPGGSQLLLNITRGDKPIVLTDISDRFGIKEMISDRSKNHEFLVSFLYYFGVMTIAGIRLDGKLEMRIPNLVMKGLYIDRIQQMLLPDPRERDEGKEAADKLYTQGDMAPLCKFIEEKYFRVFHNPDYKWANELTVKTAFLTLLYNNILYIMDSEHETNRGYADLTMIIRPDMRKFQILDILIEFKYVKLGEANLTGEEAKKVSYEELKKIPAMQKQMEKAKDQAKKYTKNLNGKYKNLRLRTFAVVSLGFERLWWEEIN